ncbi:Vitamin B12 ABC transporter, permease protein BtuC [hydrothermal vent metagenome]|uniref:Vitamin B12 ABC transporter, permease protein BtuC n=1 Tax=hydrothermal vent metagenome TaxID=652676 RepID=A0A3B1DUM6_9ZZZZ
MNIQKKEKSLTIFLIIILILTCLFSLAVGSAKIPFFSTLQNLLQNNFSQAVLVLWEIRVPRTLIGVLVGATLGLAGAAMQGLLRNPLASPGILGISGGASFGAVLVMYTGLAKVFTLALPLGGMAGAFLAIILIYLFAGANSSVQTLILAGVAVNSLFIAATSLALNLSPDPHAAIEIIFWQMGSLANRSFEHVTMAAPIMLFGWVLIFWDARALKALTLGEETALSLGFHIKRVKTRIVLGTMLSVGSAVSITGSIGFIGLVIPHILRPFVGNDPSKLLRVSALAGAILLLWADLIVRFVSTGVELKIGVLTSMLGAPFFLFLIYKMKKETI